MKEFESTFKKLTDNKYPYLRFIRAEYSKSGNTLTVFFIARATEVDGGIFNDEEKREIVSALATILPDDITFTVKYIKVTADEDTVSSKLMQALQRYISFAAQAIAPEDITIAINEYVIDIKIKASNAEYGLLSISDTREKILEALNESFIENIHLNIEEKFISEAEKAKIAQKALETIEKSAAKRSVEMDEHGNVKESGGDVFSDLVEDEDSIVFYGQSRQIKAEELITVAGREKMLTKPSYISDINEMQEKATICGKIQAFQERQYRNKNYGGVSKAKGRFRKNTTDEMLTLFSFYLDDTTGRFSVVYFPFDNRMADAFKQVVGDGVEAVVSGRISNRNGTPQLSVDKMWTARIDFSSIKREQDALIRKEARNYKVISPEKYYEERQFDINDLLNEEVVPPYLKGKTFVVYDLETTGTDTSRCMVVQLSAYKIADGAIVESFSTLVNPMCHIPAETSAIHKIYDDDVKDAPEFSEIVADFYKFSRGAGLVGHNLFGFDYPILARLSRPCGYIFDNEIFDTLAIARVQYPQLPRYNLESLAKHFNISLDCAHNADFDALATAKLFIILAKGLK